MLIPVIPPASDYVAKSVVFDSTNDYLLYPTGNHISSYITGSLWVKITEANGVGVNIFTDGNSGHFYIRRETTNTLTFIGYNGHGDPTVQLRTSTNTVLQNNWYHFLFSFNLGNSSQRHLYLNNSSDLNAPIWSAFNDVNVGTGYNWSMSPNIDGFEIAEFWCTFGTYLDFSINTNREKFVKNGRPVYLGTTGQTPTGTSPLFYFSGLNSTWHTNKGTHGGFNLTGSLTQGTTPSF